MKLNVFKCAELTPEVKEVLNGITPYSSYLYTDRNMPANVPFNTLLYMKYGDQLIAVKILMAVYINHDSKLLDETIPKADIGWNYYVQTPYGTRWYSSNAFGKTHFFYSKEDYFEHLENGNKGFAITYKTIANVTNVGYGTKFFYESWVWNGHCAEKTYSPIRYLIVNENGLNVVLSRYKGHYWNRASCVQAHIDGMEIVEFPKTENMLKINIEVVPSPPIVRTITFIEK